MSINKGDHKTADNIALGDATTTKGDFEDAASVRAYLADADELEAAVQADAVFGEINEGGPNYKNVSLMGTVMLMVKAQVSRSCSAGTIATDFRASDRSRCVIDSGSVPGNGYRARCHPPYLHRLPNVSSSGLPCLVSADSRSSATGRVTWLENSSFDTLKFVSHPTYFIFRVPYSSTFCRLGCRCRLHARWTNRSRIPGRRLLALYDLCCWFRYARYFDRLERHLDARNLYCRLCRHCRPSRLRHLEYPDPGEAFMDLMGWCHLDYRFS